MQSSLFVDAGEVERPRLLRADFALEIAFTDDQRRALNSAALNRKAPAGRVLARVPESPYPPTGKDIEAPLYAIQHAYEEATIAGYPVTGIEYAEAVTRAQRHFADSIPALSAMADALRIGRPTLANRLALLVKLCPHLIYLTRTGQIPETAAKALASLRTGKRSR